MAARKPWENKSSFTSLYKRLGEWTAMADHWTAAGTKVSEATIRRWATKHLKEDDIVSIEDRNAKLKALERAVKAAEKAAERTEANALKQLERIERESERRIAEIESQPRIATPKELADAEKALQTSNAKVNKYRQIASALAKEDNILDEVKSLLLPVVAGVALPKIKVPKVPSLTPDPFSLLLSLNDIHWGEVIHPRTVNGLNAYSPNIAAQRLQHVVDMARVWAKNYRLIGEVDELVILLNGDNFSGMHQIHPDEANEYARIAKQAMDCALVTAQAIWELANDFATVRVIAPAGDNHTRSTRKNATSVSAIETSWSSVYHEMVASLLANSPHVDFFFAPAYQVFFEIKGFTWVACHGHNLGGGGGNLGIPAYGLKKLHEASISKSVLMAKQALAKAESPMDYAEVMTGIVDHTIIGHFHQQFYAQFGGGDVRIAPTLKGADTFALDKLAKYNPAAQSLLAIHPEHDVIADHTIKVQHIVEDGETRYMWGALEGGSTASQIMRDFLSSQ